jgi:microcystin-dependent protein
MTDPFLGEIRVFPFGYNPVGWALCSGQLMSIQQNTALYSILGIVYGGDGRVTFALPDLNGQSVVGVGQGPGLSPQYQGQQSGSATVTLQPGEMPMHNHVVQASGDPAEVQTPSPTAALSRAAPGKPYGSDPNAGRVQMAPQALPPAGGGQPHNNMPPALAMNFCIALQGVFPQRP